jgi:hypothetical protein
MGGGGGNSGGGGGGNWQQAKITPKPKEEEEVTQKTKSDTNVPVEVIVGPGGPVQNVEQNPKDFNVPDQPEKRDRCLVKPFDKLLVSPKADAIKSVVVGEILRVESRGSRIEVLNKLGEPCGFVTDKMQLLFDCIANGHTFSAKVLIANGGEMKVHIRNVLDK